MAPRLVAAREELKHKRNWEGVRPGLPTDWENYENTFITVTWRKRSKRSKMHLGPEHQAIDPLGDEMTWLWGSSGTV